MSYYVAYAYVVLPRIQVDACNLPAQAPDLRIGAQRSRSTVFNTPNLDLDSLVLWLRIYALNLRDVLSDLQLPLHLLLHSFSARRPAFPTTSPSLYRQTCQLSRIESLSKGSVWIRPLHHQ